MANTLLTASIVAKAAVLQLDNNLVMARKVYRGYEEEFNKDINGYEVGASITVKRPMDFTVRDGAVMDVQDTTEGQLTLTVDKRKGIDFEFTSQELTLSIKELSERVIKPAMIQLANQIDVDLMAEYQNVPSWVGTPGQAINSFADFAKAPERADEYANPQDERCMVLCPADHWALLGNQTSLYTDSIVRPAYRSGQMGRVGNVDLYMSQNVATHTVGTNWATGSTPLTDGSAQETTYAASRTTNTQTLATDGWSSGATSLKAGDVFTIADVYAVNPVTKATLSFLKQFAVTTDISDTAGDITLTMTPAAILTGAHQTISATIGDGAGLTEVGTEATGYRQNMLFHKNAFALVTVPLVDPPGAVEVSRQSYRGTHVRVIPVYDGTNDISKWRLDVLYGVKTVDNRLAHRLSGTA
tara:strand:- start:10243 stop:11484 length:1242 start_codon:yes stop_codon:yes gene_type:complete